MRTCKVCNIEKEIGNYTVAKGYHLYTCKVCMAVKKKEWAKQNKEKMRSYVNAYKQKNLEVIKLKNKAYVLENQEKRKETMRLYRLKNKESEAENCRRRQAKKLQRTPAWLTVDDIWMMRETYALARLRSKMFGFTWHVDHIYPLQGKTVSGLHVPLNLQVITAKANLVKHNRTQVQ